MILLLISIIIPAADAETESAAAAKIILANAARQFGPPNATATLLTDAIIPVHGVAWRRAAISATAADPANKLPRRMRNSALPKGGYGRLASFFRGAFCASDSFSSELLEWKDIADRLQPESSFGRDAMLAVFQFLLAVGAPFAAGFGFRPSFGSLWSGSNPPAPAALRTLCTAARPSSPTPSYDEYLTTSRETSDKGSFVLVLRKHSAQYATTGKLLVQTKKQLHAPRDFARMCPVHRTKLLQSAAVVPMVIDRYIKAPPRRTCCSRSAGLSPGWVRLAAFIPHFARFGKTAAFHLARR